jgi:hypothetical protein
MNWGIARISMLAASLLLWGCPQDDDDNDDSAMADDDDSTATVDQTPITVSVTNDSGTALYFPWVEWWSEGLNDLLTCAVQEGEAWGNCLYGLPYGVHGCTAENLDDYCPGEPDGGSSVFALEAGENTEVEWPGTLWTIDTEHCLEGVCAREGDPAAGRYQVSVTGWREMGCFHGDCPPAKAGLVWDAYVTGESLSAHGELDVPFAGDRLELTFQ